MSNRTPLANLLNIDPTTAAGVIALLTYATDFDDAMYGTGWPCDIGGEDWKGSRTWQHCVLANLVEVLLKLMPL